ncbi:hypothetical protein H6F95_31870 [Cyanobacteria bacterium FACHB-471]|nr:hypothetical protein [Cyanobacteria bacterium FACHB-471]
MTFNATLINVHTREEKLIQVKSPTDRYCDVQAAIRQEHSSFNWAIFETWPAVRPLPIAIAA